jgi:uncharacterized protein
MPLFCIHALDHAGREAARAAAYPAHRAYLAAAAGSGVTIQASGPLVGDDGGAAIGSLLIVDCADAAAAQAFNAGDPFAAAGVWREVRIQRFDLRRGTVGTAAAPPPG